MSKRRISHQQSARIERKQAHYRQKSPMITEGTTLEGLIIKRYGSQALVESLEGIQVHCSIRPNIDSLVAGDRIIWQEEGPHQGVVISRYPRESVLGRADKHGQLKPVAANISQIMIVVASKPEISWPLLDSYLVMAEYLKLSACIVLNKADLPSNELQQRLIQEYEPLGYSVLSTSIQGNRGYEALEKILNDEISVFVGQSGVGKSSIIEHILPKETSIQTAAISAHSELGRHTTSNSRFYHLPTGGALIDSPGVREMALWHMHISDIAKGYREFVPFLSQCKYRNCTHRNTESCAIQNATKSQLIALHRYENYVKISTQFGKPS